MRGSAEMYVCATAEGRVRVRRLYVYCGARAWVVFLLLVLYTSCVDRRVDVLHGRPQAACCEVRGMLVRFLRRATTRTLFDAVLRYSNGPTITLCQLHS